MQIVIEIPDEDYKQIQDIDVFDGLTSRAYSAIRNGTPLPKGHGRLIDAEKLSYNAETCIETTDAFIDLINEVPTIIEADGGGEDES